MIDTTTNLKLKKPTPDEFYDIGIHNSNADAIDAAFKQLDDGKVAKEEGKVLSSNDYTNAEKEKLRSLENFDPAEINQTISNLDQQKQDKAPGMGLSHNDYTNADKQAVGTIKDKADKSDLAKKADTYLHFIVKLPANGWSGSAPYTQTVTVPGMPDLPIDTPVFHDLQSHDSEKANKEFSKLTDLDTALGSVTAKCLKKKPSVDLPIRIKVVF